MSEGKIVELGERSSGFIKVKGVKEPLFFHSDALEQVTFGELKVGDKLSFFLVETNRSPYAESIRRA